MLRPAIANRGQDEVDTGSRESPKPPQQYQQQNAATPEQNRRAQERFLYCPVHLDCVFDACKKSVSAVLFVLLAAPLTCVGISVSPCLMTEIDELQWLRSDAGYAALDNGKGRPSEAHVKSMTRLHGPCEEDPMRCAYLLVALCLSRCL